ncbi:MAG TPA: hypothetical protein VE130_16540 [Nitrososphaeraceae archaeon]|nr:hypothetical protein [Nitrososphaeraceae archaeon]
MLCQEEFSFEERVTPDRLYTATPTQRFMNECKNKGVNWAILSDKYGIWFSQDLHEWYEVYHLSITNNIPNNTGLRVQPKR